MRNCPITVEDVKHYFDIYGSNVAPFQGKTTKRNSAAAMSNHPCELPPSILEHHRNITLSVDIFYIQGISISTKLHFRTGTQLVNRSKLLLLEHFKQIVQIYRVRGFKASILRGDGEFKCLQKRFPSNLIGYCVCRWSCRCCRTLDSDREGWLSHTNSKLAFPTDSSPHGYRDRSFCYKNRSMFPP